MTNKNLNRDIEYKYDGYGFWDINLDKNGFIFVEDMKSLENGMIMAILTRFNEIKTTTYKDFGCRVHELIKKRKSRLTEFKIKKYVEDSIANMHRIKSVDKVILTPIRDGYYIKVYATSIMDNILNVEVNL